MLPQKKQTVYPLTHHTWKMSPHYVVKCMTFSSDWRYVAFLQTLVALKKVGCGLAFMTLKRTDCDMQQIECKANNVTANVQSDHLLCRYMLPVYFCHWLTASSTTLCWNSALVATRHFHNSSISQIGTRYTWKNEKHEKFVHFTR